MKAARQDWFEAQPDLDPDALVFLDETATNTKMARRDRLAPRGARCRMLPSPRLRPKGGRRPIESRAALTGILFVLRSVLAWKRFVAQPRLIISIGPRQWAHRL